MSLDPRESQRPPETPRDPQRPPGGAKRRPRGPQETTSGILEGPYKDLRRATADRSVGSFRRFLKKGHRDETRNRLVNRNFRASSRSLCRPRQADLRLGNSTLLLGKHAIPTSRPLAKVVLFRQKRPSPTSTEAAPSDEKCKKYEKVEKHQKSSKITKDSH